MAKRPPLRVVRGPSGATGPEWIGGIISMPAYVTGEGEPYRPELLLWLGPEGAILGTTTGRPGELLGGACESLRSTIARPMWGAPHAPGRVRVASPALAEALRAGHPGIAVVCGPTPELDEVLEVLRGSLGGEETGESPSLLGAGIEPGACASFYEAAAGLFRAAPWKVAPSDHDLFSLDIADLGIRDAVLSIIGQREESRGVVLFAGIEDFEAFVDAVPQLQRGGRLRVPAHLALNFDARSEVPEAVPREIEENDWALAGEEAYPWVLAMDEDLVARPLTARDIAVAETIALALPLVLGEKRALRAAWRGGAPVDRTLSVRAHAAEVEVRLSAPHGGSGG